MTSWHSSNGRPALQTPRSYDWFWVHSMAALVSTAALAYPSFPLRVVAAVSVVVNTMLMLGEVR